MTGIKNIIKKYRLNALREVVLFMIITMVIHFSFRYWAYEMKFWPVQEEISIARNWMADKVYSQSKWIDENILRINLTPDDETRVLYFRNNSYVGVNKSCSGLKQILQFVILMLVYPGPWRQKLWFIPAGALIIHLTNLFRIVSLSVTVLVDPHRFDFVHDNVVRPLFYIVIFTLWVIWVEKYYPKRIHKTAAKK